MTMEWIFGLLLLLPATVGALNFTIRRRSLFIPLIFVGFVPGIVLSAVQLWKLTMPWSYRFEWLPGVEMGWMLDRVSLALILLVYLISLLVHLFSLYYLREDKGLFRYFGFLGFFTTSMIGLLGADHLLVLFIFWELVGFSSYLLIGFWYRDPAKAQSARIAFIINRIADVCLLFGILVLWTSTGSAFISQLGPVVSSGLLTLGMIGMVLGAMGKSAQFPFHTWLPHAMVGPTPVSALIHAATMVAAGVYLLIRVAPIFPPEVQLFASLVGAFTALLAAFFALTQTDIKKVLAYSTISQLGYMFMAAAIGGVEVAFFHLWTHAFFKAGLFLSAGVIIHTMSHVSPEVDPQDMRHMGGMRDRLPVTFVAFSVFLLALVGLPLLSGFFSKDAILAATWVHAQKGFLAMLPFLMAVTAVLGTAYYMGRQWWMIFGARRDAERSAEPWLTVRLPLGILALGSLWFWYSLNPFGHQFPFLEHVFPTMSEEGPVGWVALLSVVLALGGLGLAYLRRHKFGESGRGVLMGISYHGLYLDEAYQKAIVLPYTKLAGWVSLVDTKVIDRIIGAMAVSIVVLGKVAGLWDRWIIDGFVNFTAYLSKKIGGLTRSFQSHSMQTQMFWLLTGVALLIFWGILFLPNV